jgi:hypothetical protein
MRAISPLILASVLLGGCASTGIRGEGNFPSITFDAPVTYQTATMRAAEFSRVCHLEALHPYGAAYGDNRSLVDKTATGEISIYKKTESAKILETIRTKPNGPNAATVTVTVLGENEWDALEMQAAKQSILTATPACRPGPADTRSLRAPEFFPHSGAAN